MNLPQWSAETPHFAQSRAQNVILNVMQQLESQQNFVVMPIQMFSKLEEKNPNQ